MKAHEKNLSILLAALQLVACGSSLTGTYLDQTGDVQLSFRSADTVVFQRNGRSEQDSYTRTGDKVIVRSSGGTVAIFQIEANGCLHSPLFTALCKAKSS